MIAQHGAIITHIIYSSLSIPKDSALNVAQFFVQEVFGLHLILLRVVGVCMFYCAFDVFSNKQGTRVGIFIPPVYKCFVVCCLMTYLPIELWYAVVKPTVIFPQQDVCIEFVIVLESVGI